MGLSNWVRNRVNDVKNAPRQVYNNAKAEHDYNVAQRLENRNQYNKGYSEGQYKRGLAEGSGQIVQADKQQGGKRGNGGARSGSSRVRGGGASYSPDWSAGTAIFGSGGGGGGFDMFGGGSAKPKAPAPTEVRKISPSGAVTIQRYEPKPHRDVTEDMWGTGGVSGVGGVARKKGERDPYDFIL